MNRYIADLHFGHRGILESDRRPYSSIEEMDEDIIQRWNSVVEKTDHTYILGDLSFCNEDRTIEILRSLNGYKHLVIGNHDGQFLKSTNFRKCFWNPHNYFEICNYAEIKDPAYPNIQVVLSHYPMPSFRRMEYGWVHLYGHVHTTPEYYRLLKAMEIVGTKNAYNVGCMVEHMGYTPRTLDEILNY